MKLATLLCLSFALISISALQLNFPKELLDYKDPENARELYEEFKQKYDKNYANEADEHRFNIFKQNLKRAHMYQSMEQGTAEYGVTQFSDLTAEEFQKYYLNAQLNKHQVSGDLADLDDLPEPPSKFDWRALGAVGPVLDQGNCGSCWAFSTMGNIEGQWFLKTGKLYRFSEQQLVDCDTTAAGCSGGLPLQAYEALKEMGGINTNEDYPYHATEGQCHDIPSKFVAYVNDSVQLSTDERKIAQWLAANGPLSAALNANMLQFYKGGISHPFKIFCSPAGLNHAVLLVGYGEENGKPFWIVKNSWGPEWGEKGYFRIYRGDGCCGINWMATSAIIY